MTDYKGYKIMTDYKEYWDKNVLNTITPRGVNNPEGFDIIEALFEILPECNKLLEVGCGTARIARSFHPQQYIGVDISADAVAYSKGKCPKHEFHHVDLVEDLPQADTALLYTVALHIPDDLIVQQLQRVTEAVDCVVIAEIMVTKYRQLNADGSYSISNQRTLEEYKDIMRDLGFILNKKIEKPYAYYKDTNITFARFVRVKK